MADPQADNLYRNDNKGLSSGSQSADLSRSGGTPEEQQTASDPHAPQADEDAQGDPSVRSAADSPPPEPSGSPRSEEPSDGGGSGPNGSSTAPAASPGQPIGPVNDIEGGSRDGGLRAEAAHDSELTLGGGVDWTGPDGSQHGRSAEIAIDGSTATSAGANGAVGGPVASSVLDIPVSSGAAGASVEAVLDRADQALDSVAGVAGGAASALAEAAAAASGTALDALDGAVAAADIGGLAGPVADVLDQTADFGPALAEPPALADLDLSGTLPELGAAAPAEAGQGLLAGLFNPDRGEASPSGGEIGGVGVPGLADNAAGLLGSPDQDEGLADFDLGL